MSVGHGASDFFEVDPSALALEVVQNASDSADAACRVLLTWSSVGI